MFYKLLSITKPLSDVLQSNKTDIPAALTLVETSKQQIKTARNDFESVCTEATRFVANNLPAGKPRRIYRLPSAFSDYVVTE